MSKRRLKEISLKVIDSPVGVCALIFTISFLVRLVYLLSYRHSPFFSTYIVDALFHHNWAQQILNGDLFSLKQGDVLFKPPFYPYFMALIDLISRNSVFALRFVQIVLGSFNCVLVYLISSKYFCHKSSIAASLIYSFYFVAIYFDGEAEVVSVAIFLTLLSFYLLKSGKGWLSLIVSACVLGLSILALPTNLLLVPLYLWILYKKASLTKAAVYLGILVLAIAPCTLRNLIHGRHFVLISANGGVNFYIGNNADYDTVVGIRPGLAWTRFSAEPHNWAGRQTTNFEQDKYWYNKCFKYIRNNPVEYTGLLLKKAVLYCMNYEIMRNRNIYFVWNESVFKKIPFVGLSLILSAGVLGLILSFSQTKNKIELYLLLFLLLLPCVLFFVTSRYRLPSLSIWSIFAGHFFITAFGYIKAEKRRFLLRSVIPFILLVLVTRSNFFVVKNPPSRPWHDLGWIHLINKDYKKTIDSFQRSSDLIVSNDLNSRMVKAEANMHMGSAYRSINEPNSAMFHLDEAIRILPDYGLAYFQKGAVYQNIDKNELAYDNFIKAFTYGCTDDAIFDFFIKALNRKEPTVHSIKVLVRASKKVELLVILHNYLGNNQLKKGSRYRAKPSFEKAYELDPNDSTTLVNLGFIALQNKQKEQSDEFYQRARAVGGRNYNYYFTHGVKEGKAGYLKSAFEYLLQASRFEETAEVYYNLGWVKFYLGENGEAAVYLKKSLEIKEAEQPRSMLEHILKQTDDSNSQGLKNIPLQ